MRFCVFDDLGTAELSSEKETCVDCNTHSFLFSSVMRWLCDLVERSLDDGPCLAYADLVDNVHCVSRVYLCIRTSASQRLESSTNCLSLLVSRLFSSNDPSSMCDNA